jgi:nucleoside-triphosphatase
MGVFVVCGEPQSGKSTLVKRLVSHLKHLCINVGGILCEEIRGIGTQKRSGFSGNCISGNISFEMAKRSNDFPDDYHRWLKHGNYFVNISLIELYYPQIIEQSINYDDVVIIDEVGSMQLKSNIFRETINDVLQSHFNNRNIVMIVSSQSNDEMCKMLIEKARNENRLYFLQRNDVDGNNAKYDELLADVIGATPPTTHSG